MKVTIDRFEGNFAVCEMPDRTSVNILKNKLPSNAREGDVLIIEGDDIRIDSAETARRKRKVKKLMDELWK